MRLVVDTNVVISALLWGGTPKALFALGETGDIGFQPRIVDRVVLSEPDDDQFIAAAIATRTDLIVSGDQHLHRLGGQFHGIPIVTRAQAVQLLAR